MKRGWTRKAPLPVSMKRDDIYYIQCTTWKDKKQVTFLHNHLVKNEVSESKDYQDTMEQENIEY